MKHPKLKNTILCQFIIYFPGLLMFLWIPIFIFLVGDGGTPAFLVGFFATAGISIWYLIRNAAMLITSDLFFSTIRQWKRDRGEYRTLRNGRGRAAVEKSVLRRCVRWGRRVILSEGDNRSVTVFFRNCVSWTVYWSVIEKRVAFCSTDVLTAEAYRYLTGQARLAFRELPHGRVLFKTKEEKKAPRAEACVVLIFADTVDDEVKTLARRPVVKTEETCILPCVVQCADGCYYTSCLGEVYETGMMGRPVENYAAAMIRALVFARRLPKENLATQPEAAFAYDLEMSLWEYIRTFREEMYGEEDTERQEREKAYRRMKDGEVRIGEATVWYKQGDRLAECFFFPADEEDEKRVILLPDDKWYYKKETGFPGADRIVGLNRRKMKKTEAETVRKRMEQKLLEEGYTIESEEDL